MFDCSVLKKRIDDTAEMVRQGDVFRLMFRLRGGLARDQYGNNVISHNHDELAVSSLCYPVVPLLHCVFHSMILFEKIAAFV